MLVSHLEILLSYCHQRALDGNVMVLQGGWRLPGDSCRPEGTVIYKNRALQTPWR